MLDCIDCDLSEVAKNSAPTLSDSLPCDGQFAKQIAIFHSSSLTERLQLKDFLNLRRAEAHQFSDFRVTFSQVFVVKPVDQVCCPRV